MRTASQRRGGVLGWSAAVILWVSSARAGHATIRINEILYAPPAGGPNLEFVELFNDAPEPVDVSGFYFVRGIRYTFPYPTFVRGRGYIVVAADPVALYAVAPHLKPEDPKFPKLVGPFQGRLDDSGETVALANSGGALLASVRYNNRGAWPAEAEKTGHSLILEDPYLDPELSKNWTRSPLMGGSPALANGGEVLFETTTIIDTGVNWRYLKGVKAQPEDPDPPSVPVEAWRQLGFNDSTWLEGPSGFGFDTPAKPDLVTPIEGMVDVFTTVYFRKEFDLTTKEGVDRLVLKFGYDDGFVAYLNGVEVARKNVDPGKESYLDGASRTGETKVGDAREEFDISRFIEAPLVVGRNVLAVQVHNSSISSNDFGFLPSLLYRTEKRIGFHEDIPVRINELLVAEPGNGWLELYNTSDVPVSLAGYFVTDDPSTLGRYRIPDGTEVGAKGWLVLPESELAAAGIVLQVPEGKKSVWLGLVTPELDYVVDAYAFLPPPAAGVSDVRYPDGDSDWFRARSPTRGQANQLTVEKDLVINEIMYSPYHPYGDFPAEGSIYDAPENQGEYVELFNRSTRTISLEGWTMTDAFDYEFPPGTVVGPGEYLVIAKDPDWLATHYGLDRQKILGPYYNLTENDEGEQVADVTGGYMADDGEKIELRDDLGNEVDGVRYSDSGEWSIWADGRGSSLELLDPRQENSEAAAWDASDESSKAGWKRYSYRGRTSGEAELKFMLLTTGILLVDNIVIRDASNAAAPNCVPYGTFDAPLKVNEILFGGTHAWSSRVVLGEPGEPCLRLVSTGRGNNRADRLELNTFNPAFPAGKELLVEFDARWVCGEGVLLTAGFNHTLAKSHLIEVPQRLGSPGAENGIRARLAGGNAGPIVSDVRHLPVMPVPLEPVQIRARVTDSDGVASVKVEWRLDGAALDTTALVDLLDDGQSDDGEAGDGIFGGQIPGQDLRKIVLFRVVATDTAGGVGTFPREEGTRTHPLRSDPSNLLPTTARTSVPSSRMVAYQHQTYTADPVHSYRMIFPKENWAYLSGRPIMGNDLVNATFVFNDQEAWYNVGIRFGNSPWTRGSYVPTNQSYRAKFGKDKSFHGWRKFKMDNQRNENLIDERVATYLFQGNSSSVPGNAAPYLEHIYCQPYIAFNHAEQKVAHIYDHVEVPAKPFLDKWWPEDSDGVLYKVDDRFSADDAGNRLDSVEARVMYPPSSPGGDASGANKENYRWFFLHRTRDKYDSFDELMELARILDSRSTPSAVAFNEGLFRVANVEEMVRTWSISLNVDDWDTWGTTRGKNCYLYRPRGAGRWTLIPWDKDLIFGNVSGLAVVQGNHAEVARVLNSPNGSRVYKNVLKDALDTFYTASYVNTFFAEVVKTAPAGTLGNPSRGAAFITGRTPAIRAYLGAQNVAFAITKPATDIAQQETSIAVVGTAPYGVWYIQLTNNGGDAEILNHEDGSLVWSGTRWTTRSIALQPGPNRLHFTAISADLLPVGDAEVVVTVGEVAFVRGDTDENEAVNLTDAVVILNHLFQGQPSSACLDALDTNDSGDVNLTDAVYLLQFLFQGGDPPPAPHPEAGEDMTADDLERCTGA